MTDDIRIAAVAVLEACRARGWTIATAESCTGGLVAGALTEIAGSSDVVDRGFVPYERKDASTRQQGQVAGRIVVTGLLRHALAEKPSSLIPND